MISQADGARLMAAHEKAMDARHERTFRFMRHGQYSGESKLASAELDAAERAFAELVAKLTDSEGL